MFVSTVDDLIDNVLTLHNYKGTEHDDFYRGIIARGNIYVAAKINFKYYFAPSRFAGYLNNNAETHYDEKPRREDDNKEVPIHGGETTPAIVKIMGEERIDDILEREFLSYCKENGITPKNNKRRYFPLIEQNRVNGSVDEFIEIIENTIQYHSILSNHKIDSYRFPLIRGEKIVVVKHRDNYFFAPAFYAGVKSPETAIFPPNFEWENLELATQKVEELLDQEFKPNELLDKELLNFLKTVVWKKQGDIKPQRYSYIELDSEVDLDYYEVLSPSDNQKPTEKIREVKTRLGHDRFKSGLISMWNGACSVTGCTVKSVLKASHAKPWIKSNDAERVNPYNGLYLTANLDSLFDKALISFDVNGNILISDDLSDEDMEKLGINRQMSVKLHERHQPFMKYHRDVKFYKLKQS